MPDLCIWVDCNPKVALDRIKSGTLRAHSDKEEYFETSELQKEIRAGYTELLSGNIEMPTPFDMGQSSDLFLTKAPKMNSKRSSNP